MSGKYHLKYRQLTGTQADNSINFQLKSSGKLVLDFKL